jgi:hypothetical protein
MNLGSISYRALILRWSVLTAMAVAVAFASAQAPAKPANDIPAASQIQAADLAQDLKSPQKPVVLYVGPKAFYTQAHIPGAENIGPVGKPEGMEKLRARAASLPKDNPM